MKKEPVKINVRVQLHDGSFLEYVLKLFRKFLENNKYVEKFEITKEQNK